MYKRQASNSLITVQTLLATNIAFAGVNSLLNLNGGSTLITSNNNGMAANVLVASNGGWAINGNWKMNGGTNIFANIATNGGASASVQLGNYANNSQIVVNPGATWWSYNANTQLNSFATNVISLYVGDNNATNNQFVVNGGTMIATNYYGQNTPIIVGVSGGSINNQMIVTNGGQVYLAGTRASGVTALNVGNAGTNNGVYVGGTNSSGVKSKIDMAIDRIAINSFNNWVRVDQGGLITNVSLIVAGPGNNAVYITNGGVIAANYVTLGRNATNDTLNIAGADSAGNLATLSFAYGNAPLAVGGSYPNTPTPQNPGTNCVAIIGQGGQVTNWNAVYVGGGCATDSNCVANVLIITNGGQIISPAATTYGSAIGYLIGCNSNSISLGGGINTSLWNLKNTSLTIGNNAFSTNNYATLFAGGIMTNAASIILGGVNSTLNLNGGVLAAGANGNLIATNSTSLNATNYIQVGGATIDSVTYAVTNRLPLLQDPGSPGGGLTKLGVGTLALLGVNTYTGPTLVNAGTLALSGSASIASSPGITLAGNATFDVSGMSSGFSLGSGQVLSNSAATATINCGVNGFNTASGTVSLMYAGAPPLAVTNGTLTLTGSTVFKVNNTGAALAANSYCLITNLTGGVVAGTLPLVTVGGGGIVVGLTNNLQVIGNALYLVVHSTAPVIVPTTLGLVSSGSPSVNYAPVIFTATVLSNGLTTATLATSNVVFLVDAVAVFTNGVNNGVAQYTNNLLTVVGSPHAIKAEYLGDANYGASTNSMSQAVTPPLSGTNLTFNLTGGGSTLSFSWPTNYLGWGLQSNAVDLTVSNDWHLVPGSTSTNSVEISVDPGQTNVYYRMYKP